MPEHGQFITLEGGEGAGKSTLAKALKARLTSASREIVLTREPGGAPSAEAVRTLLLDPNRDWDWLPLTEALLFNAARAEHLERVIRPALADGKWVICDRFADSTRAYQLAGASGIGAEVDALEHIVVGETQPDLTLVLDLSLELGRERMAQRGLPADAFEARHEAFHQSVRQAFLDIAAQAPDRCVVLDASQSTKQMLELAMKAIDERVERAS